MGQACCSSANETNPHLKDPKFLEENHLVIKIQSSSDPTKMREEKIELRKGIQLIADEEDDYLVKGNESSEVYMKQKSPNTSSTMNKTNTSVGSGKSKVSSQHLFKDDLVLNHQNVQELLKYREMIMATGNQPNVLASQLQWSSIDRINQQIEKMVSEINQATAANQEQVMSNKRKELEQIEQESSAFKQLFEQAASQLVSKLLIKDFYKIFDRVEYEGDQQNINIHEIDQTFKDATDFYDKEYREELMDILSRKDDSSTVEQIQREVQHKAEFRFADLELTLKYSEQQKDKCIELGEQAELLLRQAKNEEEVKLDFVASIQKSLDKVHKKVKQATEKLDKFQALADQTITKDSSKLTRKNSISTCTSLIQNSNKVRVSFLQHRFAIEKLLVQLKPEWIKEEHKQIKNDLAHFKQVLGSMKDDIQTLINASRAYLKHESENQTEVAKISNDLSVYKQTQDQKIVPAILKLKDLPKDSSTEPNTLFDIHLQLWEDFIQLTAIYQTIRTKSLQGLSYFSMDLNLSRVRDACNRVEQYNISYYPVSTFQGFSEKKNVTEVKDWIDDPRTPIQKFSAVLFKLASVRQSLLNYSRVADLDKHETIIDEVMAKVINESESPEEVVQQQLGPFMLKQIKKEDKFLFLQIGSQAGQLLLIRFVVKNLMNNKHLMHLMNKLQASTRELLGAYQFGFNALGH